MRIFCHNDETTFEVDVDTSDVVEGDGWKSVSLTVLCPVCKQPYGILSLHNVNSNNNSKLKIMPGLQIPRGRVTKGELIFVNDA